MPIRPAKPEDIPALVALIARSITVINAQEHTPSQRASIISEFSAQKISGHFARRKVFVHVVQNQVVGTVALEQDKLQSLFVDPPFSKQGHGKLLVQHIVQLAYIQEIKTLKVNSSMTAAPFYERLGFVKLHMREHEFGPTWAMEKAL